jgi:hypothetical protein
MSWKSRFRITKVVAVHIIPNFLLASISMLPSKFLERDVLQNSMVKHKKAYKEQKRNKDPKSIFSRK